MKKLSTWYNKLGALLLVTAVAALLILPAAKPIAAATQNYFTGVPVVTFPIQLSGNYTATTNNAARFVVPYKMRVIGVGAIARNTSAGALDVNVTDDGTSMLSSAINVSTSAWTEGTIANASVTDESLLAVNLSISGASPGWSDITVLITGVRE